MIFIVNILFFLAFIYWVHFNYTAGRDERGKKIGYYTAVFAATGLVLGIIVLDIYSEYNEMTLESFKSWLMFIYRIVIIGVAAITFYLSKFAKV
ncbi:hypothetical protein GMD78_06800 [Ornithinibacillus sp. L9]|uniref:Uncharacterized protein n=1 Tax=Ornithinibacillus caprae TaxID=2678566 RepID=A0A6N8FF93_9BACI|nr:hypothetical protein [Ornithinibacillus caprae]MUK88105.1 hypothetical protein [Ornithinibacillus caprae]